VATTRVLVAGQLPPPQGGQNIMIAQILDQLRRDDSFDTEHWPFFFSQDLKTMRRVGLGKIKELILCWWRLLRLRLAGPIDLLIFPAGGPHFVPVVRDILLLPFARLASRKLIIQFHAAGIAEKLKKPNVFHRILARLMRQADSAIVMTNYNRIDPESVKIREIDIIPIRLKDESTQARASQPQSSPARLLYVGHLCPDKGTPDLLAAFGNVLRDHPNLRLELVGEPLVPYDWHKLESDAERFGIGHALDLSGVLIGPEKWQAFERANLFVFPTVAPYESFGLVLAEAMMKSLPIVATDWRGNRDVLGGDLGGILVSTDAPLAHQIERAIRNALTRQSEWSAWGAKNRDRFESRFMQSESQVDYTNFVRRSLQVTRPGML
jgi:glycosyltransferase involved in cell wall biosynthesis